MIVPMKKITLLLTAASQKKAAKTLRKLGIVHVHDVRLPVSEDIEILNNQIAQLDKVLLLLENSETGKPLTVKSPEDMINTFLSKNDSLNRLKARYDDLLETAAWFDCFGRISKSDIEELASKGIMIDFYDLDKKAYKKLSSEIQIQKACEINGTIYFAHLRGALEESLSLKVNLMPDIEFSDLTADIKETQKEIKSTENELKSLAKHKAGFIAHRSELEKQREFHSVIGGMGDAEHFFYLQGFCPEEDVDRVKNTADREGWAYIIEVPDTPEDVPTLTTKPGWLKMIDPLFDFMGTVPGYNEYDISFWFLLFFSLFFAMLIGDAGYGLIFLGLSIWASRKVKDAPQEPFYLIYTLSGATIIWGVITGNWFGYAPIGKLPFLNTLVIAQIDSFASGNSTFLMYLCFIIGVIHLSIAHSLKAFKMIKSPKALSELGWIGIIWSLFFVAGNLVIEKPLPGFMMPLLGISIGLTLVFSNFQKNILKGIGTTLGDLPLSIISSFSDVVSYLRLFAVGYASVTVAASFNSMAIGEGITSVLAGLVAAVVLLFGHALNIILGLMAVIVHGVRLNMLEFSGQLDMQWAGKPYKPFKE